MWNNSKEERQKLKAYLKGRPGKWLESEKQVIYSDGTRFSPAKSGFKKLGKQPLLDHVQGEDRASKAK